MNLRRWLRPGMGVKRWLLLVFVGELGLALALALALTRFYRDVTVTGPVQAVVSVVTLQFLELPVRAALLAGVGVALFVVGSIRLIQALMEPFRPGGDAPTPLVEVIYQKRFLARGPRIVAIGGGTGLSSLLRGLKEVTSNLTAVVTVADDGGSSGLLRTSLGIPPVGDIRNCIVALADAEPLMSELLQYRFPVGTLTSAGDDPESPDPRGHAVGNLLLAALTAIEEGDFEEGVRQMNRVLAVRGQVLPVTPTPLTLHCRREDGSEVDGQSRIARTTGIDRVWVTPDDVQASDDALRAIAEADAIVIGPGSLFTSLLPGLLVPAIRDAVLASSATRIYVCNVATQLGETSGLDLADHVEALAAHTAPGIVDVVLGNNQFSARIPSEFRTESVRLRWPPRVTPIPRLVLDDVVDANNAHNHDPRKLAATLERIIEREGSRRRPRVARTA
ncbi:MAG TPA: gluconeogenesis factor YvcK family protein [Candidatus Limnocylindrales bacterium]|nr:gluconeogenesis factor YvcK family protein [Candidatus Limnocylindrales bacterium]